MLCEANVSFSFLSSKSIFPISKFKLESSLSLIFLLLLMLVLISGAIDAAVGDAFVPNGLTDDESNIRLTLFDVVVASASRLFRLLIDTFDLSLFICLFMLFVDKLSLFCSVLTENRREKN